MIEGVALDWGHQDLEDLNFILYCEKEGSCFPLICKPWFDKKIKFKQQKCFTELLIASNRMVKWLLLDLMHK